MHLSVSFFIEQQGLMATVEKQVSVQLGCRDPEIENKTPQKPQGLKESFFRDNVVKVNL